LYVFLYISSVFQDEYGAPTTISNEESEYDGWDTIYNEDFGERQSDSDGVYLIFHTYGGGPSGGYIAYEDGTLYSWRQEWFKEEVRTLMPEKCLRIRRVPDAPANFGAQGLQVKATDEDVGDSVFDYVM
jgi:hypothetical protein